LARATQYARIPAKPCAGNGLLLTPFRAAAQIIGDTKYRSELACRPSAGGAVPPLMLCSTAISLPHPAAAAGGGEGGGRRTVDVEIEVPPTFGEYLELQEREAAAAVAAAPSEAAGGGGGGGGTGTERARKQQRTGTDS